VLILTAPHAKKKLSILEYYTSKGVLEELNPQHSTFSPKPKPKTLNPDESSTLKSLNMKKESC